jgi:hypothetical protein
MGEVTSNASRKRMATLFLGFIGQLLSEGKVLFSGEQYSTLAALEHDPEREGGWL